MELGVSVLLYGVIAVLLGLLGIITIPNMMFKYEVYIFEQRGDTFIKTKKDYGRYINKKGDASRFLLFKAKKKISPPTSNFLFPYKSMFGSKELLYLYRDLNGNYFPIKIQPDLKSKSFFFKPDEKDVDFWYIQESKEALTRYKKENFMDKYGNYFAIGVVAVFCFLMVLVTVRQMSSVSDSLSAVSGSINTAANAIAAAVGA